MRRHIDLLRKSIDAVLKLFLNTPTRQRIVDFITSSKRTRRMSYVEVVEEMRLHVSEPTIRRALQKEGYYRRIACEKSLISKKNRQLRLVWAEEHQLTCCIKGRRLVGTMPTLSQQTWVCPWSHRAWTLQEAMLSPRCLYFSDH